MNAEFRWRHETVTRHRVEAGALAAPSDEMLAWLHGRHVCVLASQPVADLHLERLQAMREATAKWTFISVADGEEAKSVSAAERVWQRLVERGMTRDGRLIALGGGATTDLAGFVASTYLRGIEFALLPTTTLAQVDATVGAKSGVNVAGIKNMVGALAPPAWVVADPEVLATEDRRQRAAGLVEVVKLGCVFDAELFAAVEGGGEDLFGGEPDVLEPVIGRAVEAKLEVVRSDPDEQSLRRVLNFGHTLGHALEAVDRGGSLLHGEAVAWGMLFALRLSLKRAALPLEVAVRVVDLLRRFDLPPLPAVDPDAVLAALTRDKKQTRDGLVWVLMSALGEHRFDAAVGEVEVRREWQAFVAGPWEPFA